MDVSSFLGGNLLTHLDLLQQSVVWTVANVSQQLVGTDQKICLQFQQHAKLLGLNKTNLRVVAGAYGTNAQAWIGKPLEIFRDTTFFQGKQMPCIRVRIPVASPPVYQPLPQPPQLMSGPQQMYQPPQAYQQPQVAPQQPGVVGSPGTPPWGSL